MLDFIYHMTLKLFWNRVIRRENALILPYTRRCYDTTSGLPILMDGVMSLPDVTSYDKSH